MKKILLMVILITLASTPIFANVFAFDISVNSKQISYRLNDVASSVQIQVFGPLPATTVIDTFSGTTTKGLNTVTWSGAGSVSGQNYGFKIAAADATGYTGWTRINDGAQTIFQFEYPRSLSVNKNQKSPHFGMIYVSNGRVGTTGTGRACSDGIYAMYPDGSDPLAIGDTPAAGGVDWVTGTTSSPWNVFVAPNDTVYICDWSDGHSGLWHVGGDLTGNFTETLDNTGRVASGLVGTLHGSIAGCYVEGTGASTTLYTYDEDLPDATTDPGLKNIFKYTIGNGPFPWTTNPTYQIDEKNFSTFSLYNPTLGLFVNDTNGGLKRDSTGKFYVSNFRQVQDVPCLMQFSADGLTLLWDSIVSGTGSGTGTEFFLNNRGGFDIDEARNRIAMSISNTGFIVIPFNPLPAGNIGTVAETVTVFTSAAVAIGASFDPAGNFILASNITEELYIYSPPGANTFTSETSLTLAGGAPTSANPQWTLYN